MATAYPAALDTATQQPSPSASTDLDTSGYEHDIVHTNHSGAIIALETKVGLTDSNAAANAVLVGTGASTTAWTTSPTVSGTITAGGINAPVHSINTQTGTSYTLAIGDANGLVDTDNSSANTVTVPPNSSVAFPVGTQVLVVQQGGGQTTIVAGSGVTLRAKDGLKLAGGAYAGATLIKRATNDWYVIGSLEA
jgi:hypothetical protein